MMSEPTGKPPFWSAPELASAGYRVFPISPSTKSPSVEGGFYAGTTDHSRIAEWIGEGNRGDHLIAFATGMVSGVVVIDADSPQAAMKMRSEFGQEHVTTRRGGHWYFRHPQTGKVTSHGVGEKLDCKGDGGYVLAPPGGGKEWTDGIPAISSLPVLPERFNVRAAVIEDEPEDDVDNALVKQVSRVIARHVRSLDDGGGRHDHMLALCGVMLSRDVGPTAVTRILTGAWEACGGELAQRAAREVRGAVEATQMNLKAGLPATGRSTAESLTPGIYDDLVDLFDWRDIDITVGSKSMDEPSVSPESEGKSSFFEFVDLGEYLRNPPPPPDMLIRDVLYPGRVTCIFSDGGMGKTFFALWLAKRVMEKGHTVVFLDQENSKQLIGDRMRDLGADDRMLSEKLKYAPFPLSPLSKEAVEEFEKVLDEENPALVVFDSWVNFLAEAGCDENSSVDITRWGEAYTQKCRRRDIGCLILDHPGNDGERPRGSSRKLQYVDTMWQFLRPQHFDRDTVGRIELRLKKDREGWLPQGVAFKFGGDGERFVCERTVFDSSISVGNTLLASDRTVLDALGSFGETGARDKDWREEAKKRGVAKSTYYKSKAMLLEEEHVEKHIDNYMLKTISRQNQSAKSTEVHQGPIDLIDQPLRDVGPSRSTTPFRGGSGTSEVDQVSHHGAAGPDEPSIDQRIDHLLSELNLAVEDTGEGEQVFLVSGTVSESDRHFIKHNREALIQAIKERSE